MFSFIADEYVKMEGKWRMDISYVKDMSRQSHSNLLKAKRYCSLDDNCFGVKTDVYVGTAYSINFPILSKEVKVGNGQIFYLNKKESISGN